MTLIASVAVVFGWKHLQAYFDGKSTTINNKTVSFVLNNKESLEQIASNLVKNGILNNAKSFLSVANYKKLINSKLGSGMYQIQAHTSLRTLLNGFTMNTAGNGNAEVEVSVIFNNCKTLHDLCDKVSKCIEVKSDELESYITNPETLKKYDFTIEQMPAMFLPNTYNMFYDTDKEVFVQRMADEFKKFWTSERLAKMKKVGLKSPSQVVTLASIVYGEQSKNASEWPIIARLYLNRLNTGMKLQSDPTFKFCWGDQLEGVQRLTYEHRSKDCPYNTYLYLGLPPGPISMPPSGVVDAVLNPDNNNYLYMCAQANYDGLHDFTKDYSVHANNATKFQNWLASELKK